MSECSTSSILEYRLSVNLTKGHNLFSACPSDAICAKEANLKEVLRVATIINLLLLGNVLNDLLDSTFISPET